MPLITIEYDEDILKKDEVRELSHFTRELVSRVTQIEDVFVYAQSSPIRINVAPVEIFVRLSKKCLGDPEHLLSQMTGELGMWRVDKKFPCKLNLTLIPMDWVVSIGI